jgi:hypothetical protein
MKKLTNTGGLFLIFLFLSGCYNSTSEYDTVSYRNLTGLKAKMEDSFNTYTVSGAKGENDMNTIKKFKDNISKNYDLARRSEKDSDVLNQWNILNSQTDEMVQTFQSNDSLSSGYCLEKWRIINDALDKAIKAKEK